MKNPSWRGIGTALVAGIFTLGIVGEADARGGGGGGYSRGGVAAGGGLSSGGAQPTAATNPANRQSAASQVQDNRSTTGTRVPSHQPGNCNNCNDWDNHDAAAGVVAGVIIGGAVVAANRPTAVVVGTVPAVTPPCDGTPISLGGVPHYQCGDTWYAEGYADTGVVYVQVATPRGY